MIPANLGGLLINRGAGYRPWIEFKVMAMSQVQCAGSFKFRSSDYRPTQYRPSGTGATAERPAATSGCRVNGFGGRALDDASACCQVVAPMACAGSACQFDRFICAFAAA